MSDERRCLFCERLAGDAGLCEACAASPERIEQLYEESGYARCAACRSALRPPYDTKTCEECRQVRAWIIRDQHLGWSLCVAKWIHEEQPFEVELSNGQRYVFDGANDARWPEILGEWLHVGDAGAATETLIHRAAVAKITRSVGRLTARES